jgi:hypothetical protein
MKILKFTLKSCIGSNVYYTLWNLIGQNKQSQLTIIGSLWDLRSIVRNFLYDYNSLPAREKVN